MTDRDTSPGGEPYNEFDPSVPLSDAEQEAVLEALREVGYFLVGRAVNDGEPIFVRMRGPELDEREAYLRRLQNAGIPGPGKQAWLKMIALRSQHRLTDTEPTQELSDPEVDTLKRRDDGYFDVGLNNGTTFVADLNPDFLEDSE